MSFLIVANWKMNGTRSSFAHFMAKINKNRISDNIKLVICPPFTSFSDNIKTNHNISLGAQNCHFQVDGSYTGEVSARMIKELGCTYVILGHSERKNETDSEVKLKVKIALDTGLHPIVCIGENLRNENTKEVIERLCRDRLPTDGKYTVAYEPIWAIGTGYIPDNKSIAEIIRTIKLCTGGMPVLYGGSVNSVNIETLFSIDDLSGILVGSASLDFNHFNEIIQKVINLKISREI
ncbi:MAG: triosephosphate isomerase [Wolbachia endosymbiont of Fragariocoptes setiger]|nr:triosephosphate isomerase [Wolbachia endosymbiont of Fragariocoptes setiger]